MSFFLISITIGAVSVRKSLMFGRATSILFKKWFKPSNR